MEHGLRQRTSQLSSWEPPKNQGPKVPDWLIMKDPAPTPPSGTPSPGTLSG
jgi:hypothetical protein